MKKIIFYSDVAAFGGHEVETLTAAKYLCQKAELEVGFIFYENNKRLSLKLLAIKDDGKEIALYPIKYYGKRLQSFRTLVSINKIAELKRLFNIIRPDLVIIASGNIETCTLGLMAAKQAGYQVVSYVAVAHKISVMGNKCGAKIRDLLNFYYYKMPNYYITISNMVKMDLIKRGVCTKIAAVYNGIDLGKYSWPERDVCRSEFAPGSSQYLVGCIGRVLFRHKAQDFLVKTLAQHRKQLKDIKLFIVGDGPDLARLKNMVTLLRLSDAVVFVDWSDDLSRIYSALDMLIIPSWFEGVPLVMLEAMYYGMPIVASNVDGMAEILPQTWLFNVGDSDSLVETLLYVKKDDNSDPIRKNKLLIEQKYNIDEFGANFLKAINEALN